MSDVWAELNDRQRAYLRALYDCDQATEATRRERAARGHWDRTPASEWRWQMYGPVAPPSALYTALRSANLVDPGTGTTWQALEDRGLCQCRYSRDAFGVQLLGCRSRRRDAKLCARRPTSSASSQRPRVS